MFELRRTTHPTSDVEREAALADPGFGLFYTDHMAVAHYSKDAGWQRFEIIPTVDFKMHPASAVLHYGQEIFEGLKAYRREDGSVWLFRPEKNAARFRSSRSSLITASSHAPSEQGLRRAPDPYIPPL